MARASRSLGVAVVVSGALALVAGCFVGCEEPIPSAPTYTAELRPLFVAHCVRCHGGGGTLNNDPRATNGYATDRPNLTHLDFYADKGDCSQDASATEAATCQRGAQYGASTGLIQQYVHANSSIRMPLAPSEPLTDWELSLVDRWIATGYPE